jgi:excisionase family DNA binding protein
MLNKPISLHDDVIINTDQAAALLCTPKGTLVKWRSTGENQIPYIKIGRNVRYRVSDLRNWLEAHSRT